LFRHTHSATLTIFEPFVLGYDFAQLTLTEFGKKPTQFSDNNLRRYYGAQQPSITYRHELMSILSLLEIAK